MDIYINADTHCFGRNFHPDVFTSKQYTVSTFLEEYAGQINTPIYSAGTAYNLGIRETVILVFG